MTCGRPKERLKSVQNFAQKGRKGRAPMIDQGAGTWPEQPALARCSGLVSEERDGRA